MTEFKCKFDDFSGPVMVQLRRPVALAVSSMEFELEDGRFCGTPRIATMQKNDPSGNPQVIPLQVQVLYGIVDTQDGGIVVATDGADEKTPLMIWIANDNIEAITLVPEHVEPVREEPAPKIVL